MKFVSLDLETSCGAHDGVEFSPNAILQLSMTVEDTSKDTPLEDLPTLNLLVKCWEPLVGNHYALAMNYWILDIISGREKMPQYLQDVNCSVVSISGMHVAIMDFLMENFPEYTYIGLKPPHNPILKRGQITYCGKNAASFDIRFLGSSDRWFKSRMIDPGSFIIDWDRESTMSGSEITKYLNEHLETGKGVELPLNGKAHCAYYDSLLNISQIRAGRKL